MIIYYNDLKVTAKKRLAKDLGLPKKFFESYDAPVGYTDVITIDDMDKYLKEVGFKLYDSTEEKTNGILNKNIVYKLNVRSLCDNIYQMAGCSDDMFYNTLVDSIFAIVNEMAYHIVPKYTVTFIQKKDTISVICNLMILDAESNTEVTSDEMF